MNIQCVIIDDEEMSRLHLQRLCELSGDLQVLRCFDNALDAMRFLAKQKVDLVFLDIEMPDFSGIELARELQGCDTGIIFITSKESYAFHTFEFIEQVVDYLLKPLSLPRLLKALKRFQQWSLGGPAAISSKNDEQNKHGDQLETTLISNSPGDQFIFVKADRKLVRIDLNELLYVETVGDYSIFKMADKQYTVHATLKSVEERLQHPAFIKVHRSFIVNLAKITDIEDSNLLIEGRIIPISRNHKGQLLDRLMPL